MPKDKDKNKMILKAMDVTIKEINEKDRTMVVIGSTEAVDRDGDIVKLEGINLKNWKKNPVVLLNHKRTEFPVAKGIGKKAWIENKKLMFKIQFATEEEYPMADTAFRLYKGGYMNAFSIGFIPNFEKTEYPEKKRSDGATRIFHGMELIELSGTPVPANAQALMASINKAWEDNVIDGTELDDWEELIKELKIDEPIDKETTVEKEVEAKLEEAAAAIEDLTKSLEDSNNKRMELELQLKEQENDEEIDEFDSYLTELFEEFDPAGSAQEAANAERTDEDWVEDALNLLKGDKNNE